MNTRHSCALAAGVGALALFAAGCSKKDNAERAVSSPGAEDTTMDRAAESARETAAQARDSLVRTWDNVKDATYAQREEARTSLDQLAIAVDAKVSELQARSASATDATKEKWNEGMARLRTARTDLEGEIRDLTIASAENWEQAKAEVAQAWERVRQAFTELESQPAAL